MKPRNTGRGEGKLGCAIWVAIFLAVTYVGWKTVPVKIATSRLNDLMIEEAKFSVRRSPRQVRTAILKHARELDLPIRERDCQVAKANERIKMQCQFTVQIEFPGYTYDWDFDLRVQRVIYQF